jgi:hypothetical protein
LKHSVCVCVCVCVPSFDQRTASQTRLVALLLKASV